jgi:hypothetical protein
MFIIEKFEEEMKSQHEKIIHVQRTLRDGDAADEMSFVITT